jgi:hypothetical protein
MLFESRRGKLVSLNFVITLSQDGPFIEEGGSAPEIKLDVVVRR